VNYLLSKIAKTLPFFYKTCCIRDVKSGRKHVLVVFEIRVAKPPVELFLNQLCQPIRIKDCHLSLACSVKTLLTNLRFFELIL
jgi:hypothetical protein